MRAPKPQLTTSDVIDTARALADSGGMPAYAVANLHSVTFGPAITSYLRRIDATLAPFDGRFLVHGAKADVMEGQLVGDLVIVEFPDLERASAWYSSDAYQEILALRTENSDGSVVLIDGVPPDHRATDILD